MPTTIADLDCEITKLKNKMQQLEEAIWRLNKRVDDCGEE
jgi:hypothetical protein